MCGNLESFLGRGHLYMPLHDWTWTSYTGAGCLCYLDDWAWTSMISWTFQSANWSKSTEHMQELLGSYHDDGREKTMKFSYATKAKKKKKSISSAAPLVESPESRVQSMEFSSQEQQIQWKTEMTRSGPIRSFSFRKSIAFSNLNRFNLIVQLQVQSKIIPVFSGCCDWLVFQERVFVVQDPRGRTRAACLQG